MPDSTTTLLYATHRIYRTTTTGQSWSPISGDLTAGPPAAVRALAIAPSNGHTVYAATNDGRYMEHGKIYEVPGSDLFKHYWLKSVPGAGVFEAYVNRDALPYLKIYGIEDASGIYRGTLRNVGYCETWDFIKQLGLLNRKMKFDFDEVTPREVLANIVNCPSKDLRVGVSAYLKIPEHSLTLKKLEWMGLLANRKLKISTASVFATFSPLLKQRLVVRVAVDQIDVRGVDDQPR